MFEGWLRELSAVPLTDVGRRGLCELAPSSQRVRAALDAFDARVGAAVGALDDRGPGVSATLRRATRCSQREADRRARRAEVLAEVPSAASALAAGEISVEHVDVLAKAAADTSAEAVEQSGLLAVAKARPADVMRKDVSDWTRRQMRNEQLEERQRRQRSARRCVVFENDANMTVVHAEFDPVAGAEVRAALDRATDRLFQLDGGRDNDDSGRTSEQRRADALASALTGESGSSAGSASAAGPPAIRNQMIVIAHADRTAEIPGHGPIPKSELQRLTCVSDIFGLVFSTDGVPLWHGRSRRLASDQQWRSLIARDGGCIGCGAHPSRCEAHHIVPWTSQGRGLTDIDSLVLLCRHHHHLVHDQGWRVVQESSGAWTLAPP